MNVERKDVVDGSVVSCHEVTMNFLISSYLIFDAKRMTLLFRQLFIDITNRITFLSQFQGETKQRLFSKLTIQYVEELTMMLD